MLLRLRNLSFFRYLGGVLIEGGSDTTSAFLQTAVLALVLFPEAQKEAQAEIDRIIGPNRTPVVTDINELPYVQAWIKEVCLILVSSCDC